MLKNYFFKFFQYFPNNKKKFFQYSILSFLVGILELFGVALTYPFVIKLLKNDSSKLSAIILGITIIFLFIVKNCFMIFYSFLQTKFTKDIEKEINLKFIQYFLTSNYKESSKYSYAKKSNIINFIIPNVINNFIMRLLNLNVNIFIFGLISIFLIFKYPVATLCTTIFALFILWIQNKIFRPKLSHISNQITEISTKFNQCSNEILFNIKNIKASHTEDFFYQNYTNSLSKLHDATRKTFFYNTIPPYIIEPFVIVLLFILLSIISLQNFLEPNKLIASFAVIATAIFRLAPCISRIQVNINGINSVLPIVNELFLIYENIELDKIKKIQNIKLTPFNNSIELVNVNFSFDTQKTILSNINLKIEKGEFIGIAGLSGGGKTTLVDIISGLYDIDEGKILVDGISYKKMPPLKIGYIQQDFHLTNTSIRENVALGFKDIDDKLVIEALKQAQLYDFIKNNFKEGIYANPFVDNVGFSQGQKQRLIIARALYSSPDILILDEATSALDFKTEDEICSILHSLKGEKTIIAIAHRLSTIKNTDKIIFIKDGKITDVAPFEQLINNNNDFKQLYEFAKINNLK